LHKEPSLKARLELLATNITVLEMRWQHVPNLGCRNAETARVRFTSDMISVPNQQCQNTEGYFLHCALLTYYFLKLTPFRLIFAGSLNTLKQSGTLYDVQDHEKDLLW